MPWYPPSLDHPLNMDGVLSFRDAWLDVPSESTRAPDSSDDEKRNPLGTSESTLYDPFHKIHIRLQYRKMGGAKGGQKSLTIVEGLPQDAKSMQQFLRTFRQKHGTSGTVVDDVDEDGTSTKILQVQGDWRRQIATLLLTKRVARKEQIEIHGTIA